MMRLAGIAASLAALCLGTCAAHEHPQDLAELHQELAELRAPIRSGVLEKRTRRLVASPNAEKEVTKKYTDEVLDILSNDQKNQFKSIGAAMDSIWLILCGALVMFMHPGFAMLETGSCRSKNASNVLMKNLVNVIVGTVAWYIFGWAFAYGGPYNSDDMLENGFIGSKQFAAGGFMETDADGNIKAFTEPAQSKMLGWFFQWAFCTAAATIVSGGVAERVKSGTYGIYAFFMAGFIYPVVVAWTWGYGWLADISPGFMDFAGSGVVHLTGGISALAGTAILGAREGRFDKDKEEEFYPHSLPLVVFGTFCLWFGWYGFNCGSTLGLNSAENGALAAQVAMNTTISASIAGILVFSLRYGITTIQLGRGNGKYDVSGLCNGILAGLVSITAGCGNVENGSALAIGIIGAFVYQGFSMLLQILKVDDPVDASAVHGACGIWGVLAAALFDWGNGFDHFHGWSGFHCMQVSDTDTTCQTGIGGKALGVNMLMICMICLWAGGLSAIAFAILKVTGLLRIDEDTERQGMDEARHSPSKAYDMTGQASAKNNNEADTQRV